MLNTYCWCCRAATAAPPLLLLFKIYYFCFYPEIDSLCMRFDCVFGFHMPQYFYNISQISIVFSGCIASFKANRCCYAVAISENINTYIYCNFIFTTEFFFKTICTHITLCNEKKKIYSLHTGIGRCFLLIHSSMFAVDWIETHREKILSIYPHTHHVHVTFERICCSGLRLLMPLHYWHQHVRQPHCFHFAIIFSVSLAENPW